MPWVPADACYTQHLKAEVTAEVFNKFHSQNKCFN